MKKTIITFSLLALFVVSAFSQENKPKTAYEFTVVKQLPITSIKNQNRSSTCWSFSTNAFLESEIIRLGKGEVDLSEMFVVSSSYFDKSDKYVRTSGNINLSPGSSFGDALYVLKHYGTVPEKEMSGLNYGEKNHAHNEFDAAISGYVNAILKNPNGKLSTAWKSGLAGILDAYLGKKPEKFIVNGKEFTPKTYAQSLGINPDDYVSLTSYSHHPFYTQFAIEIPDNWRWDLSYNLPIEELMQVFDNSINNGYTVLWGSDVSEKGFTRNGIAIMPDIEVVNTSGSDQARWTGLSKSEIDSKIFSLMERVPEKVITQEERQKAFDNGQTTDDHGMQIFGIAKDQDGRKFYMVKNSWGETGEFKGIWYVSESFVKYKTMNIVVHKNSIPQQIRTKLGI
ncbi:MAG: C1 family peptidase [Bacteroidales bacterium]